MHVVEGDWAKARSRIEHAIAAFRTGNVALGLSEAVAVSAHILARVDEPGEALARLREAQELLDRDEVLRYFQFHRHAYRELARTLLVLGRLDEAQTLAARALDYSPPQQGATAHSLRLLGDIASHPDRFDPERAEAHYGRALSLAEPRGMRSLMARCHLGLGKLFARMRARDKAQEHFGAAATLCDDMGMAHWLQEAEVELP